MPDENLSVDPDDLAHRSDELSLSSGAAHGALREFSAIASGATGGFPGRTASKFDEALGQWDDENALVVGIVDELAGDVNVAGKDYSTQDDGNAGGIARAYGRGASGPGLNLP